jgi:hypothetical protein
MRSRINVHTQNASSATDIQHNLVLEKVRILVDGVLVCVCSYFIFLAEKVRLATFCGRVHVSAWRIPTSPRECLYSNNQASVSVNVSTTTRLTRPPRTADEIGN